MHQAIDCIRQTFFSETDWHWAAQALISIVHRSHDLDLTSHINAATMRVNFVLHNNTADIVKIRNFNTGIVTQILVDTKYQSVLLKLRQQSKPVLCSVTSEWQPHK